MAHTTLIHATCIAVGGKGVLLLGKPGSGKSDLALRLIDEPGRGTGDEFLTAKHVADDQVRLTRDGEKVLAQAPETLSGLLEIRGIGIVQVPYLPVVPVELVVELMNEEAVERMPDETQTRHYLLGLGVPRVAIDPANPSAPARLRAALICCAGGEKRRQICC
ncbi:MAG: HPr kinase/phosphorylase [Hyphomicrobiales bacterium]